MNTRRKTFLLLFLIGLLTVCAHAQAVSTLLRSYFTALPLIAAYTFRICSL